MVSRSPANAQQDEKTRVGLSVKKMSVCSVGWELESTGIIKTVVTSIYSRRSKRGQSGNKTDLVWQISLFGWGKIKISYKMCHNVTFGNRKAFFSLALFSCSPWFLEERPFFSVILKLWEQKITAILAIMYETANTVNTFEDILSFSSDCHWVFYFVLRGFTWLLIEVNGWLYFVKMIGNNSYYCLAKNALKIIFWFSSMQFNKRNEFLVLLGSC